MCLSQATVVLSSSLASRSSRRLGGVSVSPKVSWPVVCSNLRVTKNMEDLLSNLDEFSVTEVGACTTVNHPRYSKSKKMLLEASQEERRRTLLGIQKKRRALALNAARGDVEAEASDDESSGSAIRRPIKKISDYPDDYARDLRDVVDGNRPSLYASLKNVLMLSEWMIDVPSDLASEWMFTLCPIGKRTLVLAARGKTMAFTKTGHQVASFSSRLPGSGVAKDSMTILDCLVSLETRTYFVLDVICWRGQGLIDCEKECRVFYANSRLSEMEGEISETSAGNFYKFVPLEYHGCERETMREMMTASASPIVGGLDGLLFYHKRAAYTSGQTPLALWLKPHMLPDILGIEVDARYLKGSDDGAVDVANANMEVDGGLTKKSSCRKGRDVAMEEAVTETT